MAPPNTSNVRKPVSYAQAASQSNVQEKRKQSSPSPRPPPSKRVVQPGVNSKDLSTPSTNSQAKGKSKAAIPSSSSNIPTQDNDKEPPSSSNLSLIKAAEAPASTTPFPKPLTLTITHHKGSLFAAPPNTVLIHACNVLGSWGAGIALAFRNSYPNAYKRYRAHCVSTHDPQTNPVPTGTCLLIPPCEGHNGAKNHWIACLFTSARYGKARDSPQQILDATGPAMRHLLRQLEEQRAKGKTVAGLRMCKINSGLFGVKWERTVEVLEGIEVERHGDGEGEGEGSESVGVQVWSID